MVSDKTVPLIEVQAAEDRMQKVIGAEISMPKRVEKFDRVLPRLQRHVGLVAIADGSGPNGMGVRTFFPRQVASTNGRWIFFNAGNGRGSAARAFSHRAMIDSSTIPTWPTI